MFPTGLKIKVRCVSISTFNLYMPIEIVDWSLLAKEIHEQGKWVAGWHAVLS
jgi:hypothetical protein